MLLLSKELYLKSFDKSLTNVERQSSEIKSAYTLAYINNKICEENYFDVSVISRLKLLYNFINQKTDTCHSMIKYPFNLLLVFIFTFVDKFIFIIGFIGLLYAIIKYRKNPFYLLFFLLWFY